MRKISSAGISESPQSGDRILTQRSNTNPVTTWQLVYAWVKGLLDTAYDSRYVILDQTSVQANQLIRRNAGNTAWEIFTLSVDLNIVRGTYSYDAQSSTADTAGDWRRYSDANGYYFQYCTVGNATKGSGTWVTKQIVTI